MAGFLYFIPGDISPTKANFAEAGLADIFGEASVGSAKVIEGPEKSSGIMLRLEVAKPGKKPMMKYNTEKQTWRKHHTGKYWIGFDNVHSPTAVDLARPVQIEGHDIQLGETGNWLVPKARLYDGGTAFPAPMILGDKGEVVEGQPLAKFVGLHKTAQRVFQQWQHDLGAPIDLPDPPIDKAEMFEIAVISLQVNYCIGRLECSMLEIITTETVRNICEALIDVPSIMEVMEWHKQQDALDEKKK